MMCASHVFGVLWVIGDMSDDSESYDVVGKRRWPDSVTLRWASVRKVVTPGWAGYSSVKFGERLSRYVSPAPSTSPLPFLPLVTFIPPKECTFFCCLSREGETQTLSLQDQLSAT